MSVSERHQTAAQAALYALGTYVASIGLHKSMGDYSAQEAQGIVDCVLRDAQRLPGICSNSFIVSQKQVVTN